VIAFGGAPAAQGATGRITINETAVLDTASPRPNALGADESLAEQFYDGRTPFIVSAKVTGPYNVTIQYSRPVTALNSHYTLTVDGRPPAPPEAARPRVLAACAAERRADPAAGKSGAGPNAGLGRGRAAG